MTFTMKIEMIPMPCTDIDRAIAFYRDTIGFNLDHDISPAEGVRIVQLTPPGSACSISLGTGIGEFDKLVPGSIREIHLVVENIEDARAALVQRGAAMGEIVDMGGVKYAAFADPDGNTWTL